MPNYPYYNNPYMQMPIQAQQSPQQQFPPQQQIQNGGFISVPNEGIVNSYPVAPGNCVTFKIEGQPIVMEKSMGFSQFDSPKIEKYRLVKEDVAETTQIAQNEPKQNVVDNSVIDDLKDEIQAIWDEIEVLKDDKPISTPKRGPKRKDDGDD